MIVKVFNVSKPKNSTGNLMRTNQNETWMFYKEYTQSQLEKMFFNYYGKKVKFKIKK